MALPRLCAPPTLKPQMLPPPTVGRRRGKLLLLLFLCSCYCNPGADWKPEVTCAKLPALELHCGLHPGGGQGCCDPVCPEHWLSKILLLGRKLVMSLCVCDIKA